MTMPVSMLIGSAITWLYVTARVANHGRSDVASGLVGRKRINSTVTYYLEAAAESIQHDHNHKTTFIFLFACCWYHCRLHCVVLEYVVQSQNQQKQ